MLVLLVYIPNGNEFCMVEIQFALREATHTVWYINVGCTSTLAAH